MRYSLSLFFFCMILPPARSTLFPYTTLFRSVRPSGGPRAACPSSGRRLAESSHPPLRKTAGRSEEHTSELQSHSDLVCRLLLEKKKRKWWARETSHPQHYQSLACPTSLAAVL